MMRNYFLLILPLLLFSCERDPIFGLERGWLRSGENKKVDEDNGDNDPGDHDTSNVEYFITIIKPNGAESWTTGDTEEIQWLSDIPVNQKVTIQLYKNSDYLRLIASQVNNIGTFSWTLPSDLVSESYYRLRLLLVDDPQIDDFSDGLFTITNNDSDVVEDPPSYDCNIVHETTGTTFTLIEPTQDLYNFEDTYIVTLYSDTYSVGQQGGVILRLNENVVYNFGSWLVFDSNGQRNFTLPAESAEIYPSNCYTMVVVGYNQEDEYVSEPFTIY